MTYIPQTTSILEVDWDTFKNTCLTRKELLIQYVELPTTYEIYTTDSLVWHTSIRYGTAEASDFEANFKTTANARGNLSVTLVDVAGQPITKTTEDTLPLPIAGALVASLGTSGKLKPFTIHSVTGACLVVDSGLEPVVLDLGGPSPSTPGAVALTPINSLASWRDFAIEATLTGTDGTPTGGVLRVTVQCSSDGVTFTDWVCFPNVASGAAAVSYRYTAALSGAISVVGGGLSPALAANSSSNGHPGGWVRVVMVAGTGTNHGVTQIVKILGVRPAV